MTMLDGFWIDLPIGKNPIAWKITPITRDKLISCARKG